MTTVGMIIRKISIPVIVVIPPIAALFWNTHRVTAMQAEVNRRAAAEQQKYLEESHRRSDLRKGLYRGQPFPRPNVTDVFGRTLPVGTGQPVLLLFSSGCEACRDLTGWELISHQFRRTNFVFIFAEATESVEKLARSSKNPRLYFLADPLLRLHDWFGATRRRAFLVDQNGFISTVFEEWSPENPAQFQNALEAIGGRL